MAQDFALKELEELGSKPGGKRERLAFVATRIKPRYNEIL